MTVTTLELYRSIQDQCQVTIPLGLVDVAYIDGPTCAAAAAMSQSQWHELVKDGKAPKPVIRKPRFTRWLMADVRQWLLEFRTQSDFEADSAIVLNKAKKASNSAKAKVLRLRTQVVGKTE